MTVTKMLWKTLWEKEKLLLSGIVSFSSNVFVHCLREISAFESYALCFMHLLSAWTYLELLWFAQG